MGAAVTIADVSVGADVLRGSPSVSFRLNGRSSGEFKIVDKAGDMAPPEVGKPVGFFSDGVRIFTGSIDEVERLPILGREPAYTINCLCVSLEQHLDKRYIRDPITFFYTATYKSSPSASPPFIWTAGAIVRDLITTYAQGEGIGIISADSPPVDYIEAGINIDKIVYGLEGPVRVSEAIDQLAQMCGFIWFVDAEGVLHFQARDTFTAPFDVSEGSEDILRASISTRITREDKRNRQLIRINFAAFSPDQNVYVGDGSTRLFTLVKDGNTVTAARIESIFLEANDSRTAQSFGVKDVDTDPVDWYWAPGESLIEQAPSVDAIPTGGVLTVNYRIVGADVIDAEDSANITSTGTLEDGSGIYEHVIESTETVDANTSLSQAQAMVQTYKNNLKVLQYSTYTPGLKVGMLQTCSLSTTIDAAGDYLIDSIKAVHDGEVNKFKYQVSAIDGTRLGGYVRFFEKLALLGKGGGSAVAAIGGAGGAGDYDRFIWGLGVNLPLAVGPKVAPILTVERPVRLVRWRITANDAPVGASIVVDIKRNGTSIFLSGNSNKILLASAGVRNHGTVFITNPLDLDYEDELTIDVIQKGSTFAGKQIEIQVWGQVL